MESSKVKVKNSLIKLEDLIFNHYYYNIRFYDFFKRKFSHAELDFSEIQLSNSFREDEIFENKLPDYLKLKRSIKVSDFESETYYQIKYIDQLNRATTRIIKYIEEFKVVKDDDEDDNNKYILANCLLRDGYLRRFNVSRIYEVRKIKEGQQLFES